MEATLQANHAIRAMRTRLSMTQEEFAQALGITVSTVNRWENGHSEPSKLARATISRLAQRHTVVVSPPSGAIVDFSEG